MKNKTIIITSFAACNFLACTVQENTISPELTSYVLDFEEEYNTSIVDYDVFFVDNADCKKDIKDLSCVGICDFELMPRREIRMSRKTWEEVNDFDRTAFLFHELGHCQFGLGHDSRFLNKKDKTRRSFMAANADNFDYSAESFYREELAEKVTCARNIRKCKWRIRPLAPYEK